MIALELVWWSRRTPAVAVHCRPRERGELGNPWDCTIRYRSDRLARYRVRVEPDGRYIGLGRSRDHEVLCENADTQMSVRRI